MLGRSRARQGGPASFVTLVGWRGTGFLQIGIFDRRSDSRIGNPAVRLRS